MLRDIIWDFDGTLFDTYPGMVKVFMELLSEEGIEGDKSEIMDLMKVSLGYAIEKYSEKFPIGEDFRKRFEDRDKLISETDRYPFPFAREICLAVREIGGRNFLITHREDSTLKYLKYYNMDSLFTEIVTKHNGFKRKPDPEAFLYILDKYKIDKNKALGVGDRELDIEAAKNAGIKTCLFKNYEITSRAEADFVIDSLEKLFVVLNIQRR